MRKLLHYVQRTAPLDVAIAITVVLCLLTLVGGAMADVPGRRSPLGTTVPNPGTQQQELANITFPAPYNVFEFTVTCMACHGGTVDMHASHGGNWAGSNMASAARDPVFRANEMIVNHTVKLITGKDGAGNMCFRCHSPNGWYSGRFDPSLAGTPDGSGMEHSIILSTDDEGINCEACHRAMGNVSMKRPDLNPMDQVWNMMASIDDWPHTGSAFPEGPAAGNPYGDTSLQYADGMSYNGPYSGSADVYFGDSPLLGTYTGQTYGIDPFTGLPAVNPDGSYPIHSELPIGPPIDPATGRPNYQAQSISIEHPTFRSLNASGKPFIKSAEFCGSCHELTVPVLNHGMPEQRTYTEWKYSTFGRTDVTCQQCHMPRMKHQYSDAVAQSMNPDPTLVGYFPYGKDRNPDGGTAFHKLVGANRDLPQMMKLLYPEVDLEVIGAPTGHDNRIFPGMLSTRDPMWDRAQRNSELSLKDAATVQITQGPTLDPATGKWTVKVKVINNTGHRIPTGYPDGRRAFLTLAVKDRTGSVIYQSGYYDPVTAELFNDATMTALTRAQTPSIDAAANAVMIYERATCMDGLLAGAPDGVCDSQPSPNLLNNRIAFDNRIPPAGFTYADYSAAGVKFAKFDPVTLQMTEDVGRYPDGQNWDEVTYTFTPPAGITPASARAELYWQTHTRAFMEHLKDSDVSTLRPQGPPSILDPNYPLTPNYLSDVIALAGTTDMAGVQLRDNWGGIAYAAWLQTGKGAPFLVGADDSTTVAAPSAPANVQAVQVTQFVDPNNPSLFITDPFVALVTWDPVVGAEGYVVWIRYGCVNTEPRPAGAPPCTAAATADTAAWDKLAMVGPNVLAFMDDNLNAGKTYGFKVTAFNGKGMSPDSATATVVTPWDLPLEPLNLTVLGVTDTTVKLSWFDQADNEVGFIVQRQDVPLNTRQPWPPFVDIATINSMTPGAATGGNIFTDGAPLTPGIDPGQGSYAAGYVAPQPGRTYNYQVLAYNASGVSIPSLPVTATTMGTPPAPSGLAAVPFNSTHVDLTWVDNSGSETGFRVERALGTCIAPGAFAALGTVAPNTTVFSDITVAPGTTYCYRAFAYNGFGDSLPSNLAEVTTPGMAPPAAPSNLLATPSAPSPNPPTVSLTWADNALTEDGFTLQRALDAGFTTIDASFPLGVNATSYVDTTVLPNSTYHYRVQAFNAGGPSAWSNPAMAVTPGELPQAPSGLTVTQTGKNWITIAWQDNATNELGYYIEQSTNINGPYTRKGQTGVNATTYTANGKSLKRRTTYCFRVQAFNATGVSAYTDPPVCGTTK